MVFRSDNDCAAPSKVTVPEPFDHTAPLAIVRSPPIEISGSLASRSRVPAVSARALFISIAAAIVRLLSVPVLFKVKL